MADNTLFDWIGRTVQRFGRGTQQRSSGGRGYGGSLTGGGVYNAQTGMGGSSDKSEASMFFPTRIYNRNVLEVLRVESSAARKFLEMPVDDSFIQWRKYLGEAGDRAAELMQEADENHNVLHLLKETIKAGRTFGTGLLLIISKEAPLDTPLIPERIRQGDLLGLIVLDRFSASVRERGEDHMDPKTFGKPLLYYVHPSRGQPFEIHTSRVLRFNGIASLTGDGHTMYDRDWGVPEIIPAITPILHEASVAKAAAHLSQLASVPVLGVDNLREALVGSTPGELSAQQIGDELNHYLSVFHMLLIDKSEMSFEQVGVQFAGLDSVMDRLERRLAAHARIPFTRWQGASPGGLNSTGQSDIDNYIMELEARKTEMVGPQLKVLDKVLARDAGLSEVPEYTWPSLFEQGDLQQAEAAKVKMETIAIGLDKTIIDEDEARQMIDGDPIFGPLPGSAPEPPEPEPAMMPNPLVPLRSC